MNDTKKVQKPIKNTTKDAATDHDKEQNNTAILVPVSMSMAGTADPKLIHLVGKLIHSKQREDAETNHTNINMLVHQLCDQHREYQRKNVAQLTRDVQSAVTHWQKREENVTIQNRSNIKVKKRKHRPVTSTTSEGANNGKANESDEDENDEHPTEGNPNIDRLDEDEYDRAAMIYDTMVSSTTRVSGNSLNDRLLQISTVKRMSNVESVDKFKHSTNTPKKSIFRIDILDSQDEISEAFADGDGNNINATDNTVHTVTTASDLDTQRKDAQKLNSKNPTNRKRKILRRSSRADGDSRTVNVGPDGQAATSLSFTTPVARPAERYSDLGGMDHIITTIRQLVEYPITRPELYRHLGVDPPRGVLLRGPPGTYVSKRVTEIFMFETNSV
jgi:nucleoid DNA-binding protein